VVAVDGGDTERLVRKEELPRWVHAEGFLYDLPRIRNKISNGYKFGVLLLEISNC